MMDFKKDNNFARWADILDDDMFDYMLDVCASNHLFRPPRSFRLHLLLSISPFSLVTALLPCRPFPPSQIPFFCRAIREYRFCRYLNSQQDSQQLNENVNLPSTGRSTIEKEPLTNGTWTFVAPLIKPRKSHAVAFIGGKIVIAGGIAECGVEYFTLPTDENDKGQWTSIYPLPEPLNIIALLRADNCLIGICTSILIVTDAPLKNLYTIALFLRFRTRHGGVYISPGVSFAFDCH